MCSTRVEPGASDPKVVARRVDTPRASRKPDEEIISPMVLLSLPDALLSTKQEHEQNGVHEIEAATQPGPQGDLELDDPDELACQEVCVESLIVGEDFNDVLMSIAEGRWCWRDGSYDRAQSGTRAKPGMFFFVEVPCVLTASACWVRFCGR
jgi:hypothetical protein